LRGVTHGHHQIHWRRARECLNTFSGLVADIKAKLLHCFDRQWMHNAWLGARTEDLKGSSATGAKQSLRHL
jgi:hypothetical protein